MCHSVSSSLSQWCTTVVLTLHKEEMSDVRSIEHNDVLSAKKEIFQQILRFLNQWTYILMLVMLLWCTQMAPSVILSNPVTLLFFLRLDGCFAWMVCKGRLLWLNGVQGTVAENIICQVQKCKCQLETFCTYSAQSGWSGLVPYLTDRLLFSSSMGIKRSK